MRGLLITLVAALCLGCQSNQVSEAITESAVPDEAVAGARFVEPLGRLQEPT